LRLSLCKNQFSRGQGHDAPQYLSHKLAGQIITLAELLHLIPWHKANSVNEGVQRMNWDQMEGKWKQAKGSIKEKFGKLTDDDLTVINGNREKFVGKIQERYGVAKEEAQKRADEWAQTLSGATSETGAPKTGTGRP
jgi:uncharacterized protein YjbJ (UPF0337 family)